MGHRGEPGSVANGGKTNEFELRGTPTFKFA